MGDRETAHPRTAAARATETIDRGKLIMLGAFAALATASWLVPWFEEKAFSQTAHIPYIIILVAATGVAAWALWSRFRLDQTSRSLLLAAAFAGLGVVFIPHALLVPGTSDAPGHVFFSAASRLVFGATLVLALAGVPLPKLLRRPRLALAILVALFVGIVDLAAHTDWLTRAIGGRSAGDTLRRIEFAALVSQLAVLGIIIARWRRSRSPYMGTLAGVSVAMAISSVLFLDSSAGQWRWWVAHLGLFAASAILVAGVGSQLCRAIHQQELTLHYQPKIDLRTGEIKGVEALVRWQHPDRGLVPPGDFIPAIEKTDLIKPLTEWVLRAALHQHRAWRAEGMTIPVAVNVSARLFHNPQLVTLVRRELSELDLPPEALEIELTESAFMNNEAAALEVLRALAAAGVRLSIDDYGTGYSSLSYLKRLPVSEIKIDKSFVSDVVTDNDDRIIVRSTIELSHELGNEVVAEGVEDDSCRALLAELGCNVGQGYFWTKPLPAAEFAAWARDYRRTALSR